MWNRTCLFGEVQDDEMILNEYGKIMRKLWNDMPRRYRNAVIDQFIVMPNHIHGIIEIQDNDCRGEISSPDSSLPDLKTNLPKQKGGETPPLQTPTLGNVIITNISSAMRVN
jgi:hypothetical protein